MRGVFVGNAPLDVAMTAGQADMFERYQELLLRWNDKINLTSITDENDIITKHFLDSVSLMPFLPREPFSAVDVGAGAGFPGLPLAIMRDDMRLTLLDSLNKRVMFLHEAVKLLELCGCNPLHARAEDAAHDRMHREKYDVCFARAVAALPVLSEICLGFVRPGGMFLAMKGPDPAEEAEMAKPSIQAMGGEIVGIEKVELQSNDGVITHTVIIVSKKRHTTLEYPRKPGKIKKSPLL